MITRVVVLVGLAIGSVIPGIPFPLGACIGGLVAWLIWSHYRQQQRIDELQRKREFDDAVRSAAAAAKRSVTPAARPVDPATPAESGVRTSASDDAAVDALVGDLAGMLSSDASGLAALADAGPLGAIVSMDGDAAAEVEKLPDARADTARAQPAVPAARARFEAASPAGEMRLEAAARAAPAPAPRPSAVAAAPDAPASATPIPAPTTPDSSAPAAMATTTPAPATTPRRPAVVSRPAPPPADDWNRRAFAFAKRFLTEGNLPVKIGMVLMFFGVAALLKLAYEQGYFDVPVWLQHVIVASLAVAALAFGWVQRTQRRAFALALQGGALGVLLLALYSAYQLYHLLPATTAFGLVVVLVAASATLAVLQDAIVLAVLGFSAGYAAPALLSTGTGNPVPLFAWCAILNGAVFAVAWLRTWRGLNLVGFAATFGTGSAWAYKYYNSEFFPYVEPFLILFFVFYTALAILYAVRQPKERRGLVDSTLTYGTPLLAFPLQAAMLRNDLVLLSLSAVAVAALYGTLWYALHRRQGLERLASTYSHLGVVFLALAVPLALSAEWSACAWAPMGALLLRLGIDENRRFERIVGLKLQLLAGLAILVALDRGGWAPGASEIPFVNGVFASMLLVSIAGFCTAWLLENRAHRDTWILPYVWGAGWWVLAGAREIDAFVQGNASATGAMAFVTVTLALAAGLHALLRWERLRGIAIACLLAALPLALVAGQNDGPMQHGGWMVWLPYLALAPLAMRSLRDTGIAVGHVAWLWTVPLVLGLELHALADRAGYGSGLAVTLAVVPLFAAFVGTWKAPALAAWPCADGFERHASFWHVPVATLLFSWTIVALGSTGAADPLPFVPLANPVELLQLAIVAALGVFCAQRSRQETAERCARMTLFVLFLVASAMAWRWVHHFTGTPWEFLTLVQSRPALSGLTVAWGLIGVTAWLLGSRKQWRGLWLDGVAVLALVVAKLAFIDRRFMDEVSGIVSFIGIGLLFTIVGYFAPTPPKRELETA